MEKSIPMQATMPAEQQQAAALAKQQVEMPANNPAEVKVLMASPYQQLERFVLDSYELRYNVMNHLTEYRKRKEDGSGTFQAMDERMMNTLLMDAREQGIEVALADVKCLFRSQRITDYHPLHDYMTGLPQWDGRDRVTEVANRISHRLLWVHCFHIWSLALAAQWMGREMQAANSLMPILVSERQGLGKSTFCRSLLPPELRVYYADQLALNEGAHIEERLSMLALINLDEFDRLSDRQMATLKNVLQEQTCSFRLLYTNQLQQAPRMASLIATSNSHSLLTDPTGSRRFVCVDVEGEIDRSPIDYPQYYAQLKEEVERDERTWLTHDEEQELLQNNLPFYRNAVELEVFTKCFRKPQSCDAPDDILEASSADIYQYMCRLYPKAMRGSNPQHVPAVLTQLGFPRLHRRTGNVYQVMYA